MAMGRRGRDEAERAIASCRPFQNSTGSMRGTRGSTRDLGWLSSHREHAKIKELLRRATYVVWSYNTPIGCVTEDEDGGITKVYFDDSHSATTSQHQGILRCGFGDFESVGEGPWHRSNQRTRRANTPRRTPVPVVDYAPQELAARTGLSLTTNHRGVQYDPRVERDTSYERDMAEARSGARPDRSLVGSPGFQNGLTEESQSDRMHRLLDPRYANPDWVPGRDPEADAAAERRDAERVEREGSWRP